MPSKTCKPCLSADVKALIVDAYPALEAALAPVQACASGAAIDMCIKKKSEYQAFTSSCMRELSAGKFNPDAMKQCAVRWKELKAAA